MKKALSIILLCVVLIMSNNYALPTKASEPVQELKILAIGNSFSIDAMEYLWDIANDAGVRLVLGNLYIGGCSLDTHAKNISEDNAAYTYYKNTKGKWIERQSFKLSAAIVDEEWDIITVQQASHASGNASTYSKLPYVLDYIEGVAPKAKVYFHMTWAYQQDSTHSGFANYRKDQLTMYNAILSAVNAKVKKEARIVGIIPSGTVIQNLRTSYIGDTVTRDGYHLTYDLGRYTAALTWFVYFTGIDVTSVDWVPESHAFSVRKNILAIREAVTNAINKPFEITKVEAKAPDELTDADIFESLGLNINEYGKMDWVDTVHAYYNSASGFKLFSKANSTASNLVNFIASSQYTKETLPVGSVIIVDSGYKYRPEGWVNESYKVKNDDRPKTVSEGVTIVSDEWWGTYKYRAFNLSASTSRTMVEADAEHLRIYVPLLYVTEPIIEQITESLQTTVSATSVSESAEPVSSELPNTTEVKGINVIAVAIASAAVLSALICIVCVKKKK